MHASISPSESCSSGTDSDVDELMPDDIEPSVLVAGVIGLWIVAQVLRVQTDDIVSKHGDGDLEEFLSSSSHDLVMVGDACLQGWTPLAGLCQGFTEDEIVCDGIG
jgi:hypothetical protein